MATNDFASLRSITPDGLIKSTDSVMLDNDTTSLVMGYVVPKGIYFFDSYDEEDDSCFITIKLKDIPKKKPHKKLSGFCYNVKLSEIRFLNNND